jgi:hypothetical protein
MNLEPRSRISRFRSHRRAVALVGLGAGLVAYGAAAEHLWGLPSGVDVAVLGLLVLPAFAAGVWVALPIARIASTRLVVAAAGAGVLALALTLVGAGSAANLAKLACFVLIGFAFVPLFEDLWWVVLVAVLVPWVDVWSVAVGPTRYVVEEQPGFFERISVALPTPGETATVNVGPPDVVFFALFLAAADRFGLRVAWTWLGMTACLAATLALVWTWDVSGLPALPAVCLGFLLPNADLLWRHVREAYAARV